MPGCPWSPCGQRFRRAPGRGRQSLSDWGDQEGLEVGVDAIGESEIGQNGPGERNLRGILPDREERSFLSPRAKRASLQQRSTLIQVSARVPESSRAFHALWHRGLYG